MKSLKLFLEDFEEDEKELQTGKRISNADLAHSMALTTCSFEFECHLDTGNTEEANIDSYEQYVEDGKPIYGNDALMLVSYATIADRIKKVFKTSKIRIAASYHGIPTEFKIANPDYWFVEYDGSLAGKGKSVPGRDPVEIISPWVPSKDAEAFIKKFKKEVFDYFDGVTNHATGFHVNLKTKNAVANPLKLLLLFDQHNELKKFGREDNTYTRPHDVRYLINRVTDYEKHYDLNKPAVMKSVTQRIIEIMPRAKMFAINIKDYNFNDGSGRLEFRIIGDAYLNGLFETTIESVNRFIMLMSSATDDKAHTEDAREELSKHTLRKADRETISAENAIKLFKKTKKRLSPKEEERIIKAGGDYLIDYVELLVKYKQEVSDQIEDALAWDPQTAFDYAKLTKKRFEKGEGVIKQYSRWALRYAKEIIHGRFPEAEEYIYRESREAIEYIEEFIKARVPKAEPRLVYLPSIAYRYAVATGERFLAAEDEIAANAEYAYLYALNVLKGPYRAAEETIKHSPYYDSYKKNVLKEKE